MRRGADHIDDRLTLGRIVLRQAFQCVQTAESHRSLVVAELLNRAGVQLGDALLYGVSRSGGRNFALVPGWTTREAFEDEDQNWIYLMGVEDPVK